MKNDYAKSLRLPADMDTYMTKLANQWGTSVSYIYRSAVRDFIRNHQSQQR